jgi:hypothetical protein
MRRADMVAYEGTLARQLDFGEPVEGVGRPAMNSRRELRLALPSAVLRGPDKYKVLEHRRRQAQITARRLLDLLD